MSDEPAAMWPAHKRVGFRALLVYFVLYVFPFPLTMLPVVGEWIGETWMVGQQYAAVWVGEQLLGLDGPLYTGPTGSGDTTVNYVLLLITCVLTPVITAIWSLADRRPRDYSQAARWLELACRVYLGTQLLSYGLQKLIPLQMPYPGLEQLVTPLGEITPFRLVWVFIGASPIYESLSGLLEALAGLLLFWRRTRLLGASLAAVVLTNVVMLNYFYDVPVKLFSSHLLLMSVGLLLLDGRRLLALFVLNQPAPPAELAPITSSRRLVIAGELLKLVYLLWCVAQTLTLIVEVLPTYGPNRPRHELWGIHDVDSFTLDDVEHPPLLTDEQRWRALVVDYALPTSFRGTTYPGSVSVQSMSGEWTEYFVEFDDAGGMRLSTKYTLEPVIGTLAYTRPTPGQLVLRGEWDGHPVEIHLHARDLEQMKLVSRGFHWINEMPH